MNYWGFSKAGGKGGDLQITLVSVLLGRDSYKAQIQIQEEIRIFSKGLFENLVLKNDVSGKPLKNEGNETCVIAQQE